MANCASGMKVITLSKHVLEEGHGRFVGSSQELYLAVYENLNFVQRDYALRRMGSSRIEGIQQREFQEVIPPTIFVDDVVRRYQGLYSSLRRGVCAEAVFRFPVLEDLIAYVFNDSVRSAVADQ